MKQDIQGRVFVLGDNVNSDVIIPGQYLIYIDPEPLSEHAFEVLGEEYQKKLRTFDILVAGRNFGCGSAREQAATAILGLGIKAVVASSFARTFFRNAINAGLPIVECPELYSQIKEGERLRIDLGRGRMYLKDREYSFPKIPESIRQILESGGLAPYLQSQMAKETAEG